MKAVFSATIAGILSRNYGGWIMDPSLGLTRKPVRLSPEDSPEVVLAKAARVRPTPRQIARQRDEISAFIHSGMNTFTDREWGDGTEDPRLFHPTELDPCQWVIDPHLLDLGNGRPLGVVRNPFVP